MKRTFKIILIVLGLFITDLSYGNTDPVFIAKVIGSTSFRLELKETSGEAQVKLKDRYGYTLYSQRVNGSKGYHKVINVSSLPMGSYQLEVEYPTVIQTLPLNIKYGQIILEDSKLIETYKPVIRHKGVIVDINMLNLQRTSLNIRIYDNRNKIVFENKLDKDLVLGKRYDFSKMRYGKYTINLAYDNRVISQIVNIN